jgi:hypothetical protein
MKVRINRMNLIFFVEALKAQALTETIKSAAPAVDIPHQIGGAGSTKFPRFLGKRGQIYFSTFLGLPGPRNFTRLSIFFSISSTNRELLVNCPRFRRDKDIRLDIHIASC